MMDIVPASLSSLVMIAFAEIGDKSQLVCMTLAARHRHWPVLLGASAAFLVLNLLAVLFGATVASWFPEEVIAIIVALLFAAFGVHSLLSGADEVEESVQTKTGHGVFLTAFLLIFVAEFGDKTQLAVAALAGNLSPLGVWLGASVALVLVSALGVWAGRTLLQRLPVIWLHRLSGLLFLGFAALALSRVVAWT